MLDDVNAVMVSCLMVLIYYLYLNWRTRRAPHSSIHTLNAALRERWVGMVMRSGKMEILAVQTLRNSVMAANFMATTALLLIIGSLNISEKIGQWALDIRPYGSPDNVWQIKLGLLLLVFFIAFYCFSMSIRFFNHVGYMINLQDGATFDEVLFKQTCIFLNKAGSYYTLGIRCFFFCLPIILWFFGPCFLVLATFCFVMGLAALDRVPR